jgi:hypothetical protein
VLLGVLCGNNIMKAPESDTTRLMDTVLSATGEWLWAVGTNGRFTFSSAASRDLLGTNHPSCRAVPAVWWST